MPCKAPKAEAHAEMAEAEVVTMASYRCYKHVFRKDISGPAGRSISGPLPCNARSELQQQSC